MKGQKGKTIGLDKLEEKIESGIKSLQSQLQECCDRNQHSRYGRDDHRYKSSGYDTCPPYGKVCFDL